VIEHILNELGQAWGLGALALDSQHKATLCFDEKWYVGLAYDDGGLWVTTQIPDRDACVVGSQVAMRRILEVNGSLLRAGVGAFALAQDATHLQLCQRLALAELSAPWLAEFLIRFVQAAEEWHEALLAAPGAEGREISSGAYDGLTLANHGKHRFCVLQRGYS
jgi:hypothetical protein